MKYYTEQSLGFTLIELLVTIGIFTMLTGIVLANYRTYDTNALFANASEDVVLSLRQAQVYGVGVKAHAGSFTTPYGVYFEAGQNKIIMFADTAPAGNPSGDGIYTGGSDVIVDTITWKSNIKIKTQFTNGVLCDSLPFAAVSVTFTRPNPDAVINNGASLCTTDAKITLEDANTNKSSRVTISSAGQISLQSI